MSKAGNMGKLLLVSLSLFLFFASISSPYATVKAQTTYTLTTYVEDTGGNHLTVSDVLSLDPADNNGDTTGGDNTQFTYDENTEVQITADDEIVVNGAHYSFDHWEGCDSAAGTTCTITMDSDETVTAVYAPITYTLTVKVRDPQGNPVACNVNVNPPNTDVGDGWSRDYQYDEDDPVVLTQRDCGGYRFDHWVIDSTTDTSNSIQVVMDDDKTVVAVYVKQVTLTIDVDDDQGNDPGATLNLQFTEPSGGTYPILNPNVPDDGDYGSGALPTMDAGTQVSASPNGLAGYQFDHWTGACTGTGACTFTMNDDATLGAVYWKIYQLDVVVDDDLGNDPGATLNLQFTAPAGASQAPDPDGDYSDGSHAVLYRGTQVSASPNGLAGYQFDHWTGACTGTGACTFTMNDDATLGAVYWKWITITLDIRDDLNAPVGATLALTFTAPGGAEQTNAVPPDGDYGNGALQVYRGSDVSAAPNAFAGYQFDHWTGACTGTGACDINDVQADKTIGAVYWKLVDLSVVVEDELGTAIPGCQINLQFTAPAGASQAPDPDGDYSNGDTVQDIYRGTTVAPTEGVCGTYRFDHWELDGAVWSGANFPMDDDREIKAVYWLQFMLRVSTDPESPSPGRVDPITGIEWIDRGKTVALKARNFAGYFFDHWELDGRDAGTSRTLYVKMDSDHTVIAHFTRGQILKVFIEPNPRAGKVHPGSGLLTFRHNELVTLEARPFKGYVFDHWELDGREVSTEDVFQLRMNKDHVVVAYFRPILVEKPPTSMKEVGFPKEWRYYATPEDKKAMGNLSEMFAGESLPGRNVVLVTTAGKKFADWSRYSVKFILGKDGKFTKVRVLGHEFERGVEKDINVDYAVILLDFKNDQIVVSGITTNATKAALVWLLEHPEAPSMGQILVIKWADMNGNGLIESNEVFLAYGVSG